MSTLTAARVRELLDYDPLTGVFKWRVNRSNVTAGSVAGCPTSSNGVIFIRIDRKLYLAHRLAWLWMTGEWPVEEIDHKDTNHSNNRFLNLRQADRQMNQENQRRARKTNLSGFQGVSRMTNSAMYFARITTDGKQNYLGLFATPDAAHAAYVAAKRVLHSGNTL